MQPGISNSRRIFTKAFGPLKLSRNQVRALVLMQKAKPRWINAAEAGGTYLPTFYRLRYFGLAKSRMTPGGRLEPRYGLIWTITDKGAEYIDALVDELGKE